MPTNASIKEVFSRGKSLVAAQTGFAEDAVKMGAEYLFLIEDDTAPPPHALCELSRMLDISDHAIMACGGIYTTRVNPPEPIVYLAPGQGAFWNWKVGDVFECWAIGMGCTMIRTEIFQMMPRPWFKHYDNVDQVREKPEEFPDQELLPELLKLNPRNWGMTSDMYFFTKLRKMGFKVLAHGGVLPIHWDTEKNIGYWLPKGSPPVKGIEIQGQEYGWTGPELRKV